MCMMRLLQQATAAAGGLLSCCRRRLAARASLKRKPLPNAAQLTHPKKRTPKFES